MLLATIVSFCLGYLALLRQRWRLASDKIKNETITKVSADVLKPHVIFRDGVLESVQFSQRPVYIRREFAISLFLKMGIVFLFVGTLWWVLAVDLPVWSKWVIGILVLVVIWVLLRAFESIDELFNVTAWRGELVAGVTAYFLINFFSASSEVFPAWLSLGLMLGLLAFFLNRLHGKKAQWLIPALLGLALFQPFLLLLGPSLSVAGYLFGVCLLITWSLNKTASQGTALLSSFGLAIHTISFLWYPSESIETGFIGLITLAYLSVFFGQVRLLYRQENFGLAAILPILVWFLSMGFLFGLTVSWPGVVWGVMTLALAFSAYRWIGSNFAFWTPLFLAGLALISLFMFMTELLAGHVLISLYLVSAAVMLTVVTYFALPRSLVYATAALFFVPVGLSIEAILSPAWATGLWHVAAINLYTLLLCLYWLSVWFLHRSELQVYSWYRLLALLFGALAVIVSYVTVATIFDAIFTTADAVVMLYVTGALMTLSIVYYLVKRHFSDVLIALFTFTWLLPAYLSLPSFRLENWQTVSDNSAAFGVATVFFLGLLTVLVIAQKNRHSYSVFTERTISVGGMLLLGYFCLVLYALTYGLLPGVWAVVVYANLLTLLILLLYRAEKTFNLPEIWQMTTFALLAIPAFLLSQFLFDRNPEFGDFVFSVVSVGLICFIGLLLVLVSSVSRSVSESGLGLWSTPLSAWRNLLIVLCIVFCSGYSWTLLHSVLPTELASVLAFALLGLVGLYCFEKGVDRHYRNWRLIGAVVMTNLIVQFLFIEIWYLTPEERAFIAVVLAALFLFGAWYEKKTISSALTLD
jgi:hypothetical protein